MNVTPLISSHLSQILATLSGFSPTSIFTTSSTPADKVRSLSVDVLVTLAGVYFVVTALLLYALIKYRGRKGELSEPPQIFGSTQIELAWTIIPTLIIVILFLGTARVVFEVQDAPKPPSALEVTVVGHQFWWEFRYPKYNVVTANVLHIPLSDPASPTPTYMKLTSADVIHSFWVPSLAGKTDLVPNRINEMWIDPHQLGLFEGQCAQFCGTQHAKMLLRVYVDTPAQFEQWIAAQKLPANLASPTGVLQQIADTSQQINPEQGRKVFEQQACVNCHAVKGTAAIGRFGPDLTHLMSRSTIAAGIKPNNSDSLLAWITDPQVVKPGSLMPAMHLSPLEYKQINAYLLTLR